MALKINVDVNMTGFYRKSAALKSAARACPDGEVYPEGEDNVVKGRASFDRGDKTFPASKPGKRHAGTILVGAMKSVALGRRDKLDDAMQAAIDVLRDDLQRNIRAGKVSGPARSPEWIARKGHNINMVGLTGDFVNSLSTRLVPRR